MTGSSNRDAYGSKEKVLYRFRIHGRDEVGDDPVSLYALQPGLNRAGISLQWVSLEVKEIKDCVGVSCEGFGGTILGLTYCHQGGPFPYSNISL